MSSAAYEALRQVEDLLAAGIRPHVISIAAHYGLTTWQIRRALSRAGITLPPGTMSAGQAAAFEAACPHIPFRPAHTPVAAVADGAPGELELEDSCARWGLAGAAEEYDVSEDQICAWLRSYGMRGELNCTMPGRAPKHEVVR